VRILTSLILFASLIFATEVSAQRARAVRRSIGQFVFYSVPTDYINGLVADSDGSFWFTGQRSGRFVPDGETEFVDLEATLPPIVITADKRLCGVVRASSIRCARIGGGTETFPVRTNAGIAALVESRAGSLWFTEYEKDRIGRVTADGAVREFAVPPSLDTPGGMVIDRNGSVLFATRHAVARVIGDDTYQEFAAGSSIFDGRPALSGYSWPIAITADGSLWLPIGSESRTSGSAAGGAIVKMSSDGTFTTVAGLGFLYSPTLLTADRDDSIWFVQTLDNFPFSDRALIHLRSDGTTVPYRLPPPQFGIGGIAIDPSGDVWLALNDVSNAFIARLVR
jgi:sugar lactone lactonase YvrE